MIEPIDDRNRSEACDVLARGFPLRPRAYWEDSLRRVERFGENAATGVPMGQLLRDEGRAAGVSLTIASRRPGADGIPLTHVNFAAWYVDAEQRWRAPLMLRALTRVRADVITDFTPSAAVQVLLPTFGFKPITQGFVLNLAAFHQSGGCVERLSGSAGARLPIADTLLAHEPFGAVAVVLHTRDGAMTPLLYRVVKFRGIKTAHVLYCGANTQLHTHLGALSRFLRREGVVLIKLEAAIGETPPGWVRAGREVRFARGQVLPDVTDYTGSELSLFA
jgi:hypothetical protein